ncbi:MAG TPA: 30S ribosomal protein S15 [Candidatus Limnocylindria bacterium]|nr:30S ribosomal protein S15 [Candidatus Limnocylindria bacterium]
MSLTKQAKEQVSKDFGQSAQDTGSVSVQIALMTKNISALTEHLRVHAKDFSTKQGLLKIIGRRRRMLKYLERSDATMYKDVIKRLGL